MQRASLLADKNFIIAPVDKRLYGTFIEPIRNIIYGNLYNPGHPQADSRGFRKDVIALFKELKTTLIRFPGGNYLSGYHWRDGIGPRDKRPVRFDKAWRQIDRNQMGIDEYEDFNRILGVESMIAANLGTGSAEEAADEVEYCNFEKGTDLSELRRKNGHDKPHNIKLWCLGNEMDGPWQVEQKTAVEYGRIAQESAKMMKWVDPEIELVACGSCTNEPNLETYPEWDRTVLDLCYDNVEYLSLHRYYSYDQDINMAFKSPYSIEDISYLAIDLKNYLDTVLAAADFVKGKKRSSKTINISFDEWGVRSCYTAQPKGLDWSERTPPETGKRVTNVVDAVIYGSILITFLNKCDRVKIACQSIVIGSMIAADPNGGAYKQVTYYPFQHAAAYGNGVTLRSNLETPQITTEHCGDCPAVQSAVVYNEEEGTVTVFAVNMDLRNDIEFTADLRSFTGVKLTEHIQIHEKQPLVGNTFENPARVVPKNIPLSDGPIVLPALSWNVLRYKVE